VYREVQQKHRIVEPFQLCAHACQQLFLLHRQFDQISVRATRQKPIEIGMSVKGNKWVNGTEFSYIAYTNSVTVRYAVSAYFFRNPYGISPDTPSN